MAFARSVLIFVAAELCEIGGGYLALIRLVLSNSTSNDAGDASDNNVGDSICDTSPTTGDQCTLRAAIQEANAVAGDDTLTFSASLNDSTITLSTALPDLSSNVTIAGSGASSLTVQRSTAVGTPRFRIFTIAGGAITVNISGLTISNGHTTAGTAGVNGDHGGGILNNFGKTLNLKNVAISGNATGSGVTAEVSITMAP